MVLKSINECDRCGSRCERDTIWYRCEGERCPSGNGRINTTEGIDLCLTCAHAVLRGMVQGMTDDEAASWAKKAKEKPPVQRC